MVTKRSVMQVIERVESATKRLGMLRSSSFVGFTGSVEDAMRVAERHISGVIERDLNSAREDLDYILEMAD
jgi:hypothetical protein